MTKRRTEIEIEIEIDEIRFIRQVASNVAWCPQCDAPVTMVKPEQASLLAGTSVRAINRRVEDDRVHFIETEDGLLLLCVNSLFTMTNPHSWRRRLLKGVLTGRRIRSLRRLK